jgi:uncharacterized membrane protein
VFALALLVWGLAAPGGLGIRALLRVTASHLTLGRAMGIAVALSIGFPTWQAMLLAVFVDGVLVCVFYAVFSLSFRKLISVPFLDSTMAGVHRSAMAQRRRFLRWGIPGLIAFVWFPFFSTGPVVGCVIGFLLGMRPWVTVSVVMAGTVLAIFSWTYLAIGPMVLLLRYKVGEHLPLIVTMLIILLVVAYRLHRYAYGNGRITAPASGTGDDEKAEARQDGNDPRSV